MTTGDFVEADMKDLIVNVSSTDRIDANMRIKAANVLMANARIELTKRIYGQGTPRVVEALPDAEAVEEIPDLT